AESVCKFVYKSSNQDDANKLNQLILDSYMQVCGSTKKTAIDVEDVFRFIRKTGVWFSERPVEYVEKREDEDHVALTDEDEEGPCTAEFSEDELQGQDENGDDIMDCTGLNLRNYEAEEGEIVPGSEMMMMMQQQYQYPPNLTQSYGKQ
ncbi:MAG: hypothetical protein EZS28_052213, partial [Streblomastix strix]